MLLASRNQATFLEQGSTVVLPGARLYERGTGYRREFVDKRAGGELEWYPNRDSVKYREIYNIPEVQTLVRGTYRNVGWYVPG